MKSETKNNQKELMLFIGVMCFIVQLLIEYNLQICVLKNTILTLFIYIVLNMAIPIWAAVAALLITIINTLNNNYKPVFNNNNYKPSFVNTEITPEAMKMRRFNENKKIYVL